jgi:hypothetical protein
MKTKNIWIPTLLVLASLTACTEQKAQQGVTTLVAIAETLDSNASPSKKAEDLAKSSEVLLSGMALNEAYDTAQLALAQDPNNLRAGFIKAVAKPYTLLKGILIRMRPLFEKTPESQKSLNEMIEQLTQRRPLMSQYFLAGQPDILNEAQAELVIDALYSSVDELRLFVKKSKNSELTLKATTTLVPDIVERYARACEVQKIDRDYQLKCPSSEVLFNVTLNAADFEMLQGVAAYSQLQLAGLTAYDLSGFIDTAITHKQKKLTLHEFIDQLMSQSAFGKLRETSRLKDIKRLGLDLIGGINWAMSRQSELCPTGSASARNRIGMFINKGLCLPPYLSIVNKAEKVISGEETEENFENEKGEIYITKIKGIAFFEQPTADLRLLGPFRYNSCQNIESINDTSFMGSFPKGDANKVIHLMTPGCER